MKVKDRTITHYFGQSPRSDESASSLKENEAGSTPVREKNEVHKALSSDVLKCKTSGYNLNTEEETTEKSNSDFTNKTVTKKQPGKKKSVSKKKASVGDDEDFIVKRVSKTTSKRKRPQRKTQAETVLPDTESLQSVSKTESESTSSNTSTSIAKGSLDQSVTSQKEAIILSPVSDVGASGNKSKSAKNILHFFSPSKSIESQPQLSNVENVKEESQHESSRADCQGERLIQTKPKVNLDEKKAIKKSQKLKEDNGATGSTDSFKEGKKKKVVVKQKKVCLSVNNDGDAKDEQELAASPSKLTSNKMKSSVCNAFQMLMTKKQRSDSPTDFCNDSTADKSPQYINKEEDTSLDNRQFLKRKKRNRIESETEDDDQSRKQKKLIMEVDEANNQEEPGKKSLMKYFQKISKEEAEIQSQKVQFKVEALVHHSDGSPYKSKTVKGARSQQNNLKKKRVKLVSNENEIEWLGSEEITVEDNARFKSEQMADVPPEMNQDEDKGLEGETKSAEELFKNRKKRSLKLNTPKSSPSRSKRLKVLKTPGNEVSRTDSSESLSQQLETPVINIPPANNTELCQSSLPSIVKMSGKKFKQVSLDTSFLRKSNPDDIVSPRVSETTVDSNIVSSQMSPIVQLVRLSPNVLNAIEKTPSKSKQKKSVKSESTVPDEVSVEEGPSKPLQQELTLKSPLPAKQSTTDSVTPQARTWKMRVCLTPKTEANKSNSPVGSPITVDTGSEDDFDVQKIVVVKKKKKKVKSADLESKQLSRKEIEIVYEEKTVSNNPKGAVKLAPLFMRPKKPDRISEQAKQEFLQSGVPEQIKKMIEVRKSMECAEVEIFPQISHVTQLSNDLPWTPSEGRLPLKTECPESDPAPSESLKMGDLTTCDPVGVGMAEVLSSCSASLHQQRRRIATEHLPTVLSLIRSEDSGFEVIQYFKILREKYRKVLDPDRTAEIKSKKRSRSSRRSRGSNQTTDSKPKRTVSNLMWTDKYRPSTCEAIVGNKESVQGLKRWLESLRKTSQSAQMPVSKAKKSKKNDYEDDFVVLDDNCDSNNSSFCASNSALLLGCHGSGKTNCVYALAEDLGYKVLEINASERRSGKIILANLSEATQSHQVVNRSQEQAAGFFNPKNSKPKASKRKIEKKQETEEESNQNKHSLILIKDIDVVFEEEDEGFVSAVASLVSTSKRPVIFTTTDKDCPHLKRVINSSTLLLEFIPDKKALCSWLQTIALVEGAYVSRAALKDLMSTCRDDVRQCLLQLQVWMATGGNFLTQPARNNDSIEVQEKTLLEQFLEADITEGDLQTDINRSSLTDFEHHDCIGALQGRNDIELGKENNRVTIPLPVGLGRVWWNVPNFLSLPQVQVSELVLPETPEQPRRFKGLFDDSFFDMASDDEDTPNSQPMSTQSTNSQPTSSQPINSQPMSSQSTNYQPTNSQPTSSQPTNSQLESSQLTKSAKESIPAVENVAEPAVNDSKAVNVERCTQQDLDAILTHLQVMSTCDLILTASDLPENVDDFEPTPRYWQTSPRDSLSQSASKKEGPNLLIEEISRSMCHWLAEKSIEHARTVLLENPQPGRFDTLLPDPQIERRRLDVQDAEIAVLQIVGNCARLDRSAIALDYLPTLRRICASEQRRSEINTSRRNRFYHYFKGLGLHLSTDQSAILSST